MGILFWRGRVSKAEFRRQYLASVRERFPDFECREADEDGELSITIKDEPRSVEITQRLHNAYSEFQQSPRDRDEIFSRWIGSIADLAAPIVFEPGRIVPLLKSRESLLAMFPQGLPECGAPDELIHDFVNEELVVCYVHSTGSNFHFLSRADVAKLQLEPDEVRSLARRHLAARTPERTFLNAPVGWALHVGGIFEATMLIDEAVWCEPRFDGAEWILAAVPDRNTLLASVDGSPAAVWELARMAAMLERSESHPISRKLFVRRNGRFEHLDPPIVDLDHPIPRLDTIDVSRKLSKAGTESLAFGLVIAAPLSANPRSVYRLFRKMEIYLADLGCDGAPSRLAKPEDEKPRIYVSIHPGSHPEVLELLNSLHGYVSDKGGRLSIKVAESSCAGS